MHTRLSPDEGGRYWWTHILPFRFIWWFNWKTKALIKVPKLFRSCVYGSPFLHVILIKATRTSTWHINFRWFPWTCTILIVENSIQRTLFLFWKNQRTLFLPNIKYVRRKLFFPYKNIYNFSKMLVDNVNKLQFFRWIRQIAIRFT